MGETGSPASAIRSARGRLRPTRVALDDLPETRWVDRLLVDDVLEPGEAAALDHVILVEVERGHEHDGQPRVTPLDLLEELVAVQVGHHDVAHDEVDGERL